LGDIRCNAAINLPLRRTDAASANTWKGNGGNVRPALVDPGRGEGTV